MTNQAAADLIARSNRLGADPKNTNYAGGNTSAKGTETDPVTGEPVELLWVKGSGGDLGTLTEQGLAVLRLDRLRASSTSTPASTARTRWSPRSTTRLHGKGGAAPSIDTAMHGLVDAAHVDHLHPDSGIAIATAADGEELTAKIFGDKVVWVPWRRPGFQLGLDIAEIKAQNPQAIGCILGGHGITAWGDTSEEAERELALDHRHRRGVHRRARQGRPVRRGACDGYEALAPSRAPREGRRARADDPRPRLARQAAWSATSPTPTWCSTSSPARSTPRLAALGTSCPDHFLRTKVKPMRARPAGRRLGRGVDRAPARSCTRQYRADYQAYYDAHATPESPAIRGADPLIVLVPGRRHVQLRREQADRPRRRRVLRQRDQRDARRRGALDLRADLRRREVPHRVLGARGGQAAAHAEAQDARRPASRSSPARHPASARPSPPASPPRARASSSPTSTSRRRRPPRPSSAARMSRSACRRTSTDAAAVQAAIDDAVLAFGGLDLVVNNAGLSLSKPLLETTEADWDLQHDVMAKGSFLVSKAAARCSSTRGSAATSSTSPRRTRCSPARTTSPTRRRRPTRPTRCACSRSSSASTASRSTASTPTASCAARASSPRGWGANRAKTYGIEEEDLGKFYAQRTILKREVLPENVANAVFVLTGPELSHTTGLHIPVDAGVAAAFLR